jgi:mannose/cellobiose epimerase-like protein (N-acyl-D-glucosamine 2-epimerase family)
MTHVYALADRLGHPDAPELVAHGVRALLGPLRDHENGGWWSAVDSLGPLSASKKAYDHAFVLLAASSAMTVRADGSGELFDRARDVFDRYFWDEAAGKVVESWDSRWTVLDSYRGANSNMHATEALLAAHAATGDPVPARRAARVLSWFAGQARGHSWRMPEHFDSAWNPLLEHNHDRPADAFLPYGSTIGHGLEWARLALHVRSLEGLGRLERDELLVAARRLFARATTDGWAVDGEPGFVYTVGWDGTPVVRHRMHWVLAEGIGAAATLQQATGEPSYADWQDMLWRYADAHLIDRVGGSWWHELDPANRPTTGVWEGKPDVYHCLQALLLPDRPVTASVLSAIGEVG